MTNSILCFMTTDNIWYVLVLLSVKYLMFEASGSIIWAIFISLSLLKCLLLQNYPSWVYFRSCKLLCYANIYSVLRIFVNIMMRILLIFMLNHFLTLNHCYINITLSLVYKRILVGYLVVILISLYNLAISIFICNVF